MMADVWDWMMTDNDGLRTQMLLRIAGEDAMHKDSADANIIIIIGNNANWDYRERERESCFEMPNNDKYCHLAGTKKTVGE